MYKFSYILNNFIKYEFAKRFNVGHIIFVTELFKTWLEDLCKVNN